LAFQIAGNYYGTKIPETASPSFEILRFAVWDNAEAAGGLGTDIAQLFAVCRLYSEIPELPGRAIEQVNDVEWLSAPHRK